jgi:hypothetical protein
MANLETIQAVSEAGNLMPDPKDVSLWKHAMKGRMWNIVERHGIKAKHVINDLCDKAITALEEIDGIGEVDQAFAILDRLIEERKTLSFASLPPRRMATAGAVERPLADIVQRWLMSYYKEQLPKDNALGEVRKWMSTGRLYDERLDVNDRLANVTMQAENHAFNLDNAHRMHFANALPSGHALWVHVHEACAAHKHPVPIAERVGVLLAALGVTETLFNYKGTPEQARERFDKFLPTVGAIPDLDGAIQVAETYAETKADKPEDLDEWFPRDCESCGSALDKDGVCPSCSKEKVERNWTSLWPRLHEIYDAYVTPVERDRHEYIHDLLDVQSAKDIPESVSDNQIVINLKTALDARHQLKANQGQALQSTIKETQEPMAIEFDTRPLPEAAFVVLFSLYTPKGLEMKYTVRANSGEDLDRQVEDYIKRKIEAGWTTSRPNAQPMQTAQTGGSSAPAQQAPVQGSGGKPVLTETVVKVVREFDSKGKFFYTGLYTLFGSTPGKYATYKVKDGPDTTHLVQLNALTGKNWSQEQIGSEMPVNLTVQYTESDKMNSANKPYHDLVAVM